MSDNISHEVKINQKALDGIPGQMANISIPIMLSNIKKNIAKYMPVDTGSLLSAIYVNRENNGLTAVLGVGSLVDDEVNKIAIKQHEEIKNHFGKPKGGSMRDGLISTKLKWISAYRIIESEALDDQKQDYWNGYHDKKKDGKLTRYATKFLENAVADAEKNALDGVGK